MSFITLSDCTDPALGFAQGMIDKANARLSTDLIGKGLTQAEISALPVNLTLKSIAVAYASNFAAIEGARDDAFMIQKSNAYRDMARDLLATITRQTLGLPASTADSNTDQGGFVTVDFTRGG